MFLIVDAQPPRTAALERISSNPSGFFFCGMMLEPEHSSRGREKYPNSGNEKRIKSCAALEKQRHAASAASISIASNLPRELFAYKTLFCTRAKPISSAVISRFNGSGDILVSINDNAITTMNELTAAVYNCQVGDRVTAIIYRSGEYYQLELTLSEDIG